MRIVIRGNENVCAFCNKNFLMFKVIMENTLIEIGFVLGKKLFLWLNNAHFNFVV